MYLLVQFIMKKILVSFLLLVTVFSFAYCQNSNKDHSSPIRPIDFKNISVGGELSTRSMKNFNRLETDIYYPENVFPVKQDINSEGWPGDKEGRTILGLVLEAQANHITPQYLEEMMNMIPKKVNAKGYLGPIQGDTINEQQLSGHGWLLRGLCEYYIWKKDPKVKKYILDIIQNLALPTRGYHKNYPISPKQREANVGAMAGTTQNVINKWLLSSDIGCDFIFMDGVIQAYGLFPSPELKNLIDEMVARFLQMDLLAIKAQTHATLTASRALVRYYEITENRIYLKEAEKRYKLYRELGMTENYENFNWFGRPEWTEVCAIVDSYMLAVQLWQHTQKSQYLEDAHLIYYNAIGHSQRANGGFGCDNCIGPKDLSLKVHAYEAYWCCTMRGGEGLAKAIQYTYFTQGKNIYIPFYQNSEASLMVNNKNVQIKETTTYPFGTNVAFVISSKSGPENVNIHLLAPIWTSNHRIMINGKKVEFTNVGGFVTFPIKINKEAKIEYSFDMKSQIREAVNPSNTVKGSSAIVYGPLMLGYNGDTEISFNKKPVIERINDTNWKVTDGNKSYGFTPVYHLLDEKVVEKSYKKQALFLINE